ncbi:MAG: pyruvate ferredoxin oxidoreductase [Deltaproteobacteria bacterium RIFCSPLOWO2_12_FULL_43_16]|nr:MAG: pyruvate ferredoxin oxidoreductase [Deltaproteobacteria bacterium RIFCSPHIGHO2_02_FULL_43_33]OGQ37589.1 MAG: pyruvate ferredoxin oxidoreductase [Deltaproteobacteria bacterium RIFCSPLOWO2_01_FULL_42_9]OGQ61293.1 MAG: pyruvate ferredoxin oxidoreductase [Deltaproteobacteria bacterium RIFCSPLOWO2_12_FULL_43_16]
MAITMTKGQVGLTGNTAVAYAMKQINPDVCAAYPITPSTQIVEEFSGYVADGAVDTEFITVESEHSAMSACIGASAAGARVMTATSSQGLALMWEMLYIASGMRLPIILTNVNRALSSPINIHCDHSDSMGARDSGWIQLYSETVQEAYDNLFQAVRIAENEKVMLPVMVCLDGFITSHAIENMSLLDDAEVRQFIGEYKALHSLLDTDNPVTYGAMTLPDTYIEFKRQQSDAIARAKDVVSEIGKDFGNRFGREYGLMEKYMLDDADVAIVILSSAAGTTKVAVDELRKKGKKVGILRPRLFRPFPFKEVADALKGVKAVACLDRVDSMSGFGGPLFNEVRSSLYESEKRPKIASRIFGLGGRDYKVKDAVGVFEELLKIAETGKVEVLTKYITM